MSARLVTKQIKETTWKDIVACDNLKVGDEISCELTDGTTVVAVAAAINPFGNGENAYVFRDCIGKDMAMNDGLTTKGGWRDSKMRRYVREEIYPLLPNDLKAVIKPRTIRQKVGGEELESQDELWLLSFTEVFGKIYSREIKVDVGDIHFPLFYSRKNRIKMDNEGFLMHWWLRSAYNANNFNYVRSGGSYDAYNADYSYGVALGFLA